MDLGWLVGLGPERWLVSGAALILTYCLHAGAWAAAGGVLARRRRLSSAARHSLLKWALFGPLATTLLALALPAGWRWSAQRVLEQSVAGQTSFAAAELSAPRAWCALVLGCWTLAMGLGLLRWAGSAIVLWLRLQRRQPQAAGRVRERLDALLARSALGRVSLTENSEWTVPFALGVREICVPASLASLADAELDAVLAHELAHLERRDGLWFPAIAAAQSLLWLQPLNHWLGWRVRHWAELACDDRAIELTGDPLGLARALTRIAERVSAHSWGVAPSAGRSAASLLERVRRLAELRVCARPAAPAASGGRRVAALAALGAALCSVRLELAQASPAPVAGAPAATGLAEPPPSVDPVPGGEDFCRQLNDLTQTEQRVQEQLQQTSPGEAERRAELSSELGEARARRAWAEERYERWLKAP